MKSHRGVGCGGGTWPGASAWPGAGESTSGACTSKTLPAAAEGAEVEEVAAVGVEEAEVTSLGCVGFAAALISYRRRAQGKPGKGSYLGLVTGQ